MSYVFGVIACALLVAADQYTKWLATTKLAPLGSYDFLPGLIEFHYHRNEGAAWGLLQGWRWVFVAFTVIVIGVVVYFYIKLPRNRASNFARGLMVLVSAGALGNGIDRFRQGYVVDFLNFQFISFPVFNVADTLLVCGTILLSIWILFFYKEIPAVKEKNGTDLADTDRT